LYHYIANPSLSVDDAMLTLNVASRSFSELLRPLAMEQTAPVGFLLALKVATTLGGVRDPVLRLVPLLAGIALPFALWRVARRLVAPWPAVLAAAFAALSTILIEYSVSVKPYTVDALVTLVLVGLTLDVLDDPQHTARWWRLAWSGVVAVLCSTPAPLVLAGCGAALAMSTGVRRRPAAPLWFATLALLWVGTFVSVYVALTHVAAESPYLQSFWSERFLTPAVLRQPMRAWAILRRVPTEPFLVDAPIPALAILLWVVAGLGIWSLGRRDGAVLALVAGPLVALFLASALRRYPIAPRVCLFAAPLTFLIYAEAWGRAFAFPPASWPRRTAVVAAVVWLLVLATLTMIRPVGGLPTRLQAEEFERRAAPGEPVYVFAGAIPTWTRYTTDWDAVDRPSLAKVLASQELNGGAFHNAPSRGRAVGDSAGEALVLVVKGRTEVLGLAPGIQWREDVGYSSPRTPDANWGEREIARLRAVTDSTAWIAVAHDQGVASRALLGPIAVAGGRAVFRWNALGTSLVRYRFPPLRAP
jgi:hypothetical protein